MFRSIKSQIIVALSFIIIAVLGATAYLTIEHEKRGLNQDIFKKAFSFAQLTHQGVIDSFEQNYQEGAFANFERDLANIYSLNEDVISLAVYDYQGESLFFDENQDGELGAGNFLSLGSEQVDEVILNAEPALERLQSLFPSVQTSTGRVIYIESTGGPFRYTNFNGQNVSPIEDTDQIINIVYPFRDPSDITTSYSVGYKVSYQALDERIEQLFLRLSAIAVLGIVVALFIGLIVAQHITSPLKKLSKGAVKIGKGDLETRIPIRSKSEVGKLAAVFNQMASDLQVSTKAMIEQEKTAKELELAADIQKHLLPSVLPTVKGLDIAASLSAATQVGGDCYDFIPTHKKNGELLFYIADVTGHGVGAGLVSAINNALIPALMDHYDDTQSLVVALNKLLKIKTGPSIFVTLVMALWGSEAGVVQVTQAGHNPIIHYQAKEKKAIKLAHGGVALGMIEDISKVVSTKSTTLLQDDLFVMYTDGITEARDEKEVIYGTEALMRSIEKNSQLSTAQAIHDGILKDLHDFMGAHPQDDDVTLMVMRRKK